jgi:uncharacterized membrane protein
MTKARLEAFSDGVIAIIITIMVLELRPPHEPSWAALSHLWPALLSYGLSFFFIGVYWANHHHLLHTCRTVNAQIIWLNSHLLFWLSLIPFVTAWLGETYPAPLPTVIYGAIMLTAGLAYWFLQQVIARQQTEEALRAGHRVQTRKGLVAIVLYSAALPLAWRGKITAALMLYLLVALAYVLPERRFERRPESE